VFSTMYVRDHMRPAFHKALGVDPTDYDMVVLRLTSEISKQVFPFTLDIDSPAFRRGFDRLWRLAEKIEATRAEGGILGRVKRLGLATAAAATFVGLYLRPVVHHQVPIRTRLVPAW
jgi:magnesium-protoporphyrin IX monomethyl ester (oxidative) cyclase